MFKNYIKTALRNTRQHKGYSLINILGLAIGMAGFLLIFLYIQDELGYDRYNKKAERIFRVAAHMSMSGQEADMAVTPAPMAETLAAEIPEVEDAVRFREEDSFILQYNNLSYREKTGIYCDASFFNVFTVPMLAGDPATALAAPNSIVLSRKTAEKYFFHENPIGKTIKLEKQDFEVTGVFEKIPDNSHFHFDVLVSLASLPSSRSPNWVMSQFQTYILLREDADPDLVAAKFPFILDKFIAPQIEKMMGKSLQELKKDMGLSMSYYLQPLVDIHLNSELLGEFEPNSDRKYIYIFSPIAFFILLIACINFMNLATARASSRAKEVGLRKVMGSSRQELIRQFLMESLLTSLVSIIAALLIVWLTLPIFNQLAGKNLQPQVLWHPTTLIGLAAIVMFTGILAGGYPAFILSAFQPAAVIKGTLTSGARSHFLRRGLVIFQFSISIFLLIATLVIFNQMHYIMNKKIGYAKEKVLVVNNADLLGEQAQAFKEEMEQHSQIFSIALSSYLPVPSGRSMLPVVPAEQTDPSQIRPIAAWDVDMDYIKTMGMKVIQGRDFTQDFSGDVQGAILNQQAAHYFGWADPIGEKVKRMIAPPNNYSTHTVIGVVEDFHFESMRAKIEPLVLFNGRSTGLMSLRIKTKNPAEIIAALEQTWQTFVPAEPVEYSFLDDKFHSIYSTERRFGGIVSFFSGLAILIGCLGLFGLASFTSELRTKEIGIRKVLGASAPNIVRLLLKEYLLLVTIANLFAWPLAYFFMNKWLQEFAYRQAFSFWIPAAAGSLTLLIAFITVGYQTRKVAVSDPVKSLRYE